MNIYVITKFTPHISRTKNLPCRSNQHGGILTCAKLNIHVLSEVYIILEDICPSCAGYEDGRISAVKNWTFNSTDWIVMCLE